MSNEPLILTHTQSILHSKEGEENGDCFRTSVACLLNLDPEEVPHFYSREVEDPYGLIKEWFGEKGYAYLEVSYSPEWVVALRDACYILSGPSPRFPGFDHTCVAQFGKVIWDPHPDRAGLGEGQEDWSIGLIIPLNFQ